MPCWNFCPECEKKRRKKLDKKFAVLFAEPQRKLIKSGGGAGKTRGGAWLDSTSVLTFGCMQQTMPARRVKFDDES